MSSNIHLGSLLEKLNSQDADFRFMALNDLCAILQNQSLDLSLDPATSMRLGDGITKSLTDSNGEVQNLAVKCLPGLMSRKLPSQLLLSNLDKLSKLPPDVASTAIRSIIPSLPSTLEVANKIVPGVLSRLKDPSGGGEGASEVFQKFGHVMDVEGTINELLPLIMESPHWNLSTKRTLSALSFLVVYASDDRFSSLISLIIESFNRAVTSSKIRVLVSLCNGICRNDPSRFGNYLKTLTPFVLTSLENEDDELKETVLIALDTFLTYASDEMRPFTSDILHVGSAYLKYDPNYAGGDEDEEMADADEYDDEEDDGGYSDDDDISWKLRRLATKLLRTLIGTQPDLLLRLSQSIGPQLISSFSEREENVRVEVLHTYKTLIHEIGRIPKDAERKRRRESTEEGSPRQALITSLPRLVQRLSEALSSSFQTQSAAIMVLQELVATLSGGLDDVISTFIHPLEKILRTPTSSLRIEALYLVTLIAENHASSTLLPYKDIFFQTTILCISDHFYKVCSAALMTSISLITVFQDELALLEHMSSTLMEKSKSTESDVEVRDRAITALGILLCNPKISSEAGLAILLDRLKGETTRIVTSRAIESICNSNQKLSQKWVEGTVRELTSLLYKSNQTLRSTALITLKAVTPRLTSFDDDLSYRLQSGLAPILGVDDMHLVPNALVVLLGICRFGQLLISTVVLNICSLVRNSMTSLVLDNCLMVIAMASSHGQGDEFLSLLRDQDETAKVTLGACKAIAACIMSNDMEISKYTESAKRGDLQAVMIIGRVGQLHHVDESVVTQYLQSQEEIPEDLQHAAAIAFGGIVAGQFDTHVESVMHGINGSDQYLYLQSLQEALSLDSMAAKPYAASLWEKLFSVEMIDGRNLSLAAECISRLTILEPQFFLPRLSGHLNNESNATRRIVMSALRYTFTDTAESFDDLLRPILIDFLRQVEDEDLEIRKLSLATLNAAAHNKPHLISDKLPALLSLLYKETHKNKALVREVQMGPFRHEVDDGLDTRKTAYETMFALLDNETGAISWETFLDRVLAGMDDDHDIKILSNLMLQKIARIAPQALRLRKEVAIHTSDIGLDKFIEKLRAVLSSKTKDNAVKQDIEKLADIQKSVLRSISSLQKSTLRSSPLDDLIQEIRQGKLRDEYAALDSGDTGDRMDIT